MQNNKVFRLYFFTLIAMLISVKCAKRKPRIYAGKVSVIVWECFKKNINFYIEISIYKLKEKE